MNNSEDKNMNTEFKLETAEDKKAYSQAWLDINEAKKNGYENIFIDYGFWSDFESDVRVDASNQLKFHGYWLTFWKSHNGKPCTRIANIITDTLNPQQIENQPGIKHDSGKPQAALLADFSRALSAVAEVATYGAEKYTPGGWLSVPDAERRYQDAKWRHLLAGGIEETDAESGLRHLAHECWNSLAVLELTLRDQEKNND